MKEELLPNFLSTETEKIVKFIRVLGLIHEDIKLSSKHKKYLHVNWRKTSRDLLLSKKRFIFNKKKIDKYRNNINVDEYVEKLDSKIIAIGNTLLEICYVNPLLRKFELKKIKLEIDSIYFCLELVRELISGLNYFSGEEIIVDITSAKSKLIIYTDSWKRKTIANDNYIITKY